MPDAKSSHDDHALLRDYCEHQSAEAFTELVRRHVDAVFSSALRRAHGDRALAEDITQQVFTDFARKAAQLPPGTVAGGWLHRHTGFTASHFTDRERRRRAREQEAAAMNALTDSSPDAAWHQTAPLLDAAMDSLPAEDRDALVLRFFERRDFRAVGQALGVSDDTAQKRVTRALDKLRGLLTRRGVTSSGAALSAIMLAHTVSPAPAALVAALPGRALAGAAATGGTVTAAIAGMSVIARWKLAGLAAALAAAGALPFVIQKMQSPPPSAALPSPALTSASPPAKPVKVPGPTRTAPAAVAAPQSLSEIITAAAGELRGGAQNISATTRALSLLAQIPTSQSREALTLVQGVTDESARALLYRYVLSQWAESEPWQAINFANDELPEQYRLATTEGVLAAWAARDPEAVIGWSTKLGGAAPAECRQSLLGSIFKTLASRDLAKAFFHLEHMQSSNERAQALRGVLETVQTQPERERILSLAGGLKDEELRTQTRRAVVENWTRHAAAAAAWVEKSEPAWERPLLMDTLGLTWMQSDPAAAAAWWLAHEPGRDTLVKIINVWSQKDPDAAGAWLDAQPPGPQSDAARMTFARQVASLDSAGALTWAATISDESMRESTISHIYEKWRDRDAAAAATFLQQSGWPAERLARLQPP